MGSAYKTIKGKKHKTCYFCKNPGLFKEHVPPKALFPETSDLGHLDLNYRKELITVPSCEKHNQRKSLDDEFLLASLAGIIGNNPIAYLHTITKVRRAFEKTRTLFDSVIKNARNTEYKSSNGIIFPAIEGQADTNRLIDCFEKVAYGIFYHHFKTRFLGTCRIIPTFLTFKNEDFKNYVTLFHKIEEHESKDWSESIGANPEIFTYRISPLLEHGIRIMALTFYEGTKVYALFKNRGIKIEDTFHYKMFQVSNSYTFSFPDGSEVKFK